MGLTEAVRSVLTQYATFSGRARRSEFWYWQLALILLSVVFTILAVTMGTGFIGRLIVIVYSITSIAVIVPALAVAVRRMHDTGRSGFWLLVIFIPLVGWFITLVLLALPSEPDRNEYGQTPR